MSTETVQIVDRGRGPQLSNSRLTVMDVFYYLHRGYDFDFIHQCMPILTRDEFDLIVAYVNEHRAELAEEDRLIQEITEREIAAQHARGGIFAPPEEGLTTEQRVARLKEKLAKKLAERNGAGTSR